MYWHSRTTPKTFPLQVYSYVLYNFQIPCNLWVEEILCVYKFCGLAMMNEDKFWLRKSGQPADSSTYLLT